MSNSSQSPEQLMALLDEFFDQHLPITHYLNMRCHAFSGDAFSLAIDLQPSLNDKLTAFGGSLYCLCVMNGWGMIYLQCRQRGINPNMVISRAEIKYRAPVADEIIVAQCFQADSNYWDQFVDDVRRKGKAKTQVTSSIIGEGGEAVTFSGDYAVIGTVN